MAELTADKSHDPTPRRREQARASGRVAQSHDLTSAAMLVGAIVLLMFSGGRLVELLAGCLRGSLAGAAWRTWSETPDASGQLVADHFRALTSTLARPLLGVLAGAALVGVASGLLQTGFLVLPGRIAFDGSRASPLAGLRRMFSAASFARLASGMFKVGVVTAVACADLWSRREALAALVTLPPQRLAAEVADICLATCLKLGATLLVLAAIDYLFERWKLERELKMSPQEIREELRDLEGHPQIAARRRTLEHSLRGARGRQPAAGAGAGRQ